MDLQLQVLEERRFLTRDVPSHWGDSEAAKALGLETYLSVPVYRNEGGGSLARFVARAFSRLMMSVDSGHELAGECLC